MIRAGIYRGREMIRLTWLLYLVELLLAALIGLQVAHVAKIGVGHSMDFQSLLSGFDYTVIHDFLKHNGEAIRLILYQLKLILPSFLVLNVFTTAGIMYCGDKNVKGWGDFWFGASRFFIVFLVNFSFYILAFLLWTLIIFVPAIFLIPFFLEEMACEIWLFRILSFLVIVYLIGIAFIVNASMSSKSMMVQDEINPWHAFRQGIVYARVNYFSQMKVFLLFLILVFLANRGYQLLHHFIEMDDALSIVFMFLLGQAFIFTRVWLRMMYIFSIQHQVAAGRKV